MIPFLIKGLVRDKSRSIFPLITVMAGSALTVFLVAFVSGSFETLTHNHAIFSTGHVKVMTRGYAEIDDQAPNDLALNLTPDLDRELQKSTTITWVKRIRFNGILDVPDTNGDTRVQGPVIGLGIDFQDNGQLERRLLNLDASLISGRFPTSPQEILIADAFAKRITVKPGDTVTLISTASDGGLAMMNFTISGTLAFGISAMDHSLILADFHDIQYALNMPDMAGEILGFTPEHGYNERDMKRLATQFNQAHIDDTAPLAPIMKTLTEQNGLGELFRVVQMVVGIVIGIFVMAMVLIQWNAGLIGTLRRHHEFGVRIALGEPKRHIYGRMLLESVLLSVTGSALGTLLGLLVAWPVAEYGISITSMMNHTHSLFPTVLRAQITPICGVVGFIPGVFASVLGTVMAGRAIFKRHTAELFKELEA